MQYLAARDEEDTCRNEKGSLIEGPQEVPGAVVPEGRAMVEMLSFIAKQTPRKCMALGW